MKYLKYFNSLSELLSDNNYGDIAICFCEDTKQLTTLEMPDTPSDPSANVRCVVAIDDSHNNKQVLFNLGPALKEKLGYNDEEVEGAYYAITQRGTFKLSDIDLAKTIKDNWDPATTSISQWWRDDQGPYFFPHLDFAEVTDAFKAFHGNNQVKFFPIMHFPKCTNITGLFWYTWASNPLELILDVWNDGSQYFMYDSTVCMPMTITAPNATDIGYLTVTTEFYAPVVYNVPKVTSIATSYVFGANSTIVTPIIINAPALTKLKFPSGKTISAKITVNAGGALLDLSSLFYRQTVNVIPEINTQGKIKDLSSAFYRAKFFINGDDILKYLNLDISECENFTSMLAGNTTALSEPLQYTVDLSKLNFDHATTLANMFYNNQTNTQIPTINAPLVTNITYIFGCANTGHISTIETIGDLICPLATSLQSLLAFNDTVHTIGDIDCSSIAVCPLNYTYTYYVEYLDREFTSSVYNPFYHTDSLENIGHLINFGQSLTPVVVNGTTYDTGIDFSESPLLTHESLMNVINSLVPTPEPMTIYLKLGAANLAKLTADEIQTAVGLGWTVIE